MRAMSMDILYEELLSFIYALNTFNDSTAKTWDELQRAWESADELWRDDSTRKHFEQQWRELGDSLKRYREQGGERYVEFLLERKRALDEYLGQS